MTKDASLDGHMILIIEDEPLIALDVAESLRDVGAQVATAMRLRDGLRIVDTQRISAAVLDFRLKDGADCRVICEQLTKRGVPFVLYTGYDGIDGFPSVPIVMKPATRRQIVSAVFKLINSTAS
jgi:DNA-binding NtrC family response regulator